MVTCLFCDTQFSYVSNQSIEIHIGKMIKKYKINHENREIEIYRDEDLIDPIIIDFDTFLVIMRDIQSQIDEYCTNIL